MARWIKNIEWSIVLHKAVNVACVIVLFIGLIFYLDKCSDDDVVRIETARQEGYDEGYNVGYEEGREQGCEDVMNEPRDYDLYSHDNIIDMLDDLFDGNIPDDAYWYLNN